MATPSPLRPVAVPFKCWGRGGYTLPSILNLPLLPDFDLETPPPQSRRPIGRGRGKRRVENHSGTSSPLLLSAIADKFDDGNSVSSMAMSEGNGISSSPSPTYLGGLDPELLQSPRGQLSQKMTTETVSEVIASPRGQLLKTALGTASSQISQKTTVGSVSASSQISQKTTVGSVSSEDSKTVITVNDTVIPNNSNIDCSEAAAAAYTDEYGKSAIYLSSEVSADEKCHPTRSSNKQQPATKKSLTAYNDSTSDSESTASTSEASSRMNFRRNKDKSESLNTARCTAEKVKPPFRAQANELHAKKNSKQNHLSHYKEKWNHAEKKKKMPQPPSWVTPKPAFSIDKQNFPALGDRGSKVKEYGHTSFKVQPKKKAANNLKEISRKVLGTPLSSGPTSEDCSDISDGIPECLKNMSYGDEACESRFEISNLHKNVPREVLKEFFRQYGMVESLEIVPDENELVKVIVSMEKGIDVSWIINCLDGAVCPEFESLKPLQLRVLKSD